MAKHGNILITNAGQLLTCVSDGPKRKDALSDVGMVEDGAVLIEDGLITKFGQTSDVVKFAFGKKGFQKIDAGGRVVMPGFIDSHTHIVHVGSRLDEFEMRIKGADYLEILKAGGGILASRRATQSASISELVEAGRRNIEKSISFGVTTIEAKSGYGLDVENELKMLRAIKQLDQEMPVDIVATFLGAHAIPHEYKGRSAEYINLCINEMLPVVKDENLAEFVDIFIEEGVFSIEEGRRMIQAGLDAGLPAKIHADEINPLGGAQLAAGMGAASADHLIAASDEGIKALAASDTIACLLPGTSFFLKKPFARAGEMINAGCAIALATDDNPGSCRTENIQLVMTIACLYLGLTPAEAINACTINAAHALRRGYRIGSLEVGKQGDVVIMDVTDYRQVAYQYGVNHTWKVFKGGNEIFSV